MLVVAPIRRHRVSAPARDSSLEGGNGFTSAGEEARVRPADHRFMNATRSAAIDRVRRWAVACGVFVVGAIALRLYRIALDDRNAHDIH
ncbi:hypothetical protein AB0B39_12370 [Micromonospora sp. NPDC049114]|uniref:hypothetical protein n=1 Tax=unclassified Micromonospora TaxID=2617518 RepID=UPI0033DAA427